MSNFSETVSSQCSSWLVGVGRLRSFMKVRDSRIVPDASQTKLFTIDQSSETCADILAGVPTSGLVRQIENPVGTDLLQKHYNHTNESAPDSV
jgi:hypothetical protein